MTKLSILALFSLFFTSAITAQNLARINGQLIIKEKEAKGKITLSSGTFFYDTKIKKLIYNLIFPQKITWVSKDTLLYKIANDRIVEKLRNYALPEFSIFHLALYGGLSDYGLSKSAYKITKTEKLDETVFITYLPDKSLQGLGKVIVAQKKGLLSGVVFYNKTDKILSKQFYNKYTNQNGISFPMEVVSISYANSIEHYKVTTYSKISINDFKDTKNFDIKLPSNY